MKKKKIEEIEEEEDEEEDAEYEDDEEEIPEIEPKKKSGRPKKPVEKPKADDLDWQYVRQPEITGIINSKTEEVITDMWEALRRILSLVEEAAKNTR